MLERELNSARALIDANSNLSLTQPTMQNTYRTSYGISSPLPYTTATPPNYYNIGYAPNPNEIQDLKKQINDVNISSR